MNNLQERINQAQSLNTGLILDKEDVKRLQVKANPKPKKNTPLQKMIDDLGARRIVVAGYCRLIDSCNNDCPLFKVCIVEMRLATREKINKCYEILVKENQR